MPTAETPHDLPELLVVTPWYPSPDNTYAGTFVREAVRSLEPYYDDVVIIHAENVLADDTREPVWRETPEGRVLWVPVPMDPLTSRGDMMLLQREALHRHALPYLANAPLVHCHVGAPTGAAIVPLIREDARLVVTEHATYLSKVFRDEKARALYGEVYARADVFTAVSGTTAALIKGTFPDARDDVAVIANPVPLRGLPLKTDLTPALSRWLYVGNLVEHKGVRRLVRSFAVWVAYTRDPNAHLSLVGDGPLREELTALAEELGVLDRVSFLGRVEPDHIGEVYVAHDVLVHLSHIETFGLTCVEAAACGLPVVVTECGAPQDTLVVHYALGLASFVPLGDAEEREQVEPVIDALSRLQQSLDPANARMSRAHLQRAYGAKTIGAELHTVLSGGELPKRAVFPGMRLLAVAMTAKQARASEAALLNFCSFGGGGIYITAVRPRMALPRSVRVIDISGVERATVASRLERLLVLRAPALALRGAGRAAKLLGSAAPRAGARAQNAVTRLQERNRASAHEFRYNGLYALLWRNIGPWYTARKLEHAGTLQALDLSEIDCVILADEFMTPIVVRALRLNPDLDVRTRWTRRAIARVYAEQVLAAGYVPLDEVGPDVVDVESDEQTEGTDEGPVISEAVVEDQDNIRS